MRDPLVIVLVLVVSGGMWLTRTLPEPVVPVPSAWRLDWLAGNPDGATPQADRLTDFQRTMLLARVVTAADRVAPYDWQALDIRFTIACDLTVDGFCRFGLVSVADQGTHVDLSPAIAYLTDEALDSLVAHKLAHAWQFALAPDRQPGAALDGMNLPDIPAAELEADCLVTIWGFAPPEGVGMKYWDCTEEAFAAVAADWRRNPLN
jgi:hypothetical protein